VREGVGSLSELERAYAWLVEQERPLIWLRGRCIHAGTEIEKLADPLATPLDNRCGKLST
jgi:hypothetical protein